MSDSAAPSQPTGTSKKSLSKAAPTFVPASVAATQSASLSAVAPAFVPSPSAAPEVGVPSPASSNRRRQPAKKRSENAVQATASSSEQSQPTQSSEAQVATAAASSRKSQKPVKKEKRPAAPAPVEAVSAAAQPEDSTLPLDNRRRQAPPKGQRPPKAQRQPNSAVSAESVPASATAAGGAADATPVVPAASASNAKTANPSKSRARQRRSASPHSDISHVTNSTTTTTSSKGGKHEKLSGSQMESLQLQLSKGTYICAICTEFVKPQHAIWSCLRCSHALHLSCAEKWAQSCNKAQAADPSSVDVVASMLQGSMFSLSRSSRPATSSGGISMNGPTQSKSSSDDALWWRCPTCSFEMVEKPKYICFCGKHLNPDFNPYYTPHSCGDPCQKARPNSSCPHLCNVPCHPGPCPPCTVALPPRSCGCGRSQLAGRCGESQVSCGAPCTKMASCNVHQCTLRCHEGPCPPCTLTELQSCFCGATQQQRPCGSGTLRLATTSRVFSCGHPCNRTLACGNHKCLRTCHAGGCGPCVRQPDDEAQRCACGKSIVPSQRESCLDALPTCGQPCQRQLDCGKHACESVCHDSPCAPCAVHVSTMCRCQRQHIDMTCSELSQRVKQHSPQRQSDSGTDSAALCDHVCNKRMSCGLHKCQTVCCADRQGGPLAVGHLCTRACNKPLSCGNHFCTAPCHTGPCHPCNITLWDGLACACGQTRLRGPLQCGTAAPECKRKCIKARACGHPCAYTCHDGACPPCVVLTDRQCGSGHSIVKHVRCSAPTASCGKPCGHMRECGLHACQRTCHSGPCATVPAAISASSTDALSALIVSCQQTCARPRRDCGHPCALPCHPHTLECPIQTPCTVPVPATCECGRLSKSVTCQSTRAGDQSKAFHLPCDSKCAIEERNRRFREALQISARDETFGSSNSYFCPFPRSLVTQAAADMELVLKLEKALSQLLYPDADTPPGPHNPAMAGRTLALPPMPRSQRSLVHQLASFYFVDSEAVDPEPHRSIRLASTERSSVPMTLLSQAVRVMQSEPSTLRCADQWPPRCVLQFYDLAPGVHAWHVRSYLNSFSCEFRFSELGESASSTGTSGLVAVFADPPTAQSALNALKSITVGGVPPFRVRLAATHQDATQSVPSTPASDLSNADIGPAPAAVSALAAHAADAGGWRQRLAEKEQRAMVAASATPLSTSSSKSNDSKKNQSQITNRYSLLDEDAAAATQATAERRHDETSWESMNPLESTPAPSQGTAWDA